jgi:predicted phosphodiesterase
MKFRYSLISDMHVNHPQPKTPYELLLPFVIVAGDTSNGLDGLKFLNKIKNRGYQIFAVDGNHESYCNDSQGRNIGETEAAFYQGIDQQYEKEVEPGLTILGCNGWYFVDDERDWLDYMNDGRYAGNAQEVNETATSQARWLDTRLEELKGKAIVVTHTAPCMETLNEAFAGHFSNEWYYNPRMGEVMAKHADKILVWNHGHTHAPQDKIVGGVRVVCNPRGYPGENPGWKPLTVEVEYEHQ